MGVRQRAASVRPTVSEPLPAYIAEVYVEGKRFTTVVADTGACTSIISKKVVQALGLAGQVRAACGRVGPVESVDGSTLAFEGRVEAELVVAGATFRHEFEVMKQGDVVLLGNDFLGKHGSVVMIGMGSRKGKRVSALTLTLPCGGVVHAPLVIERHKAKEARAIGRIVSRPVVYNREAIEVPSRGQVQVLLSAPLRAWMEKGC